MNKKKNLLNNENLCPVPRKRIKTPIISHWKKINQETADYLQEMGIGVLDSEESSSSAASAIVLAVSASGDENSNEAKSSLDAHLFRNQNKNIRLTENSVETFTNTDTNVLLTNDAFCRNVNNNHLSFNIFTDELGQLKSQPQKSQTEQILLPQHKKLSMLSTAASTVTSTNSNSSSPTNNRSTRSPLATVSCNNMKNGNNTQKLQQQQLDQIVNPPSSLPNIADVQSYENQSKSPSLPSTSQQAAIIRQQQHLQVVFKHQQHQKNETHLNKNDFFLYRNPVFKNTGKDYFSTLSDEIILQIFKYLPKKTLIRCSSVCRSFYRCANDETLWTRLDLGLRCLRAGALHNILNRGVVILRLAQAKIRHPVFEPTSLNIDTKLEIKLQYLDLSLAGITKVSLKMLLSRCRQLKKLSLEHLEINDCICNEIAANTNIEALNLAMCIGLESWSVRKIMESLTNLNSLNISWTNLSVDAVTSVVTNITPNIMRLNIAGCRKTMYDSHLNILNKRCTQLLELDLSDCTGLTGNAISIICNFTMLEYLSLSRCYLIPVSKFMELGQLSSLTYLDVFGILSDPALEMLEMHFPNLGINKFIFSSVARPTVGTRRTSIWGLRTRD